MTKRLPLKRRAGPDSGLGLLAPLVERVRSLVQSARHAAARSINTLQVRTNFEIGRLIVEHEQAGSARAEYGKETLKQLSASLTAEFGRGFSEDNLGNMRRFFLLWKDRAASFSETISRKSLLEPGEGSTAGEKMAISKAPSRKFCSAATSLRAQLFPLCPSYGDQGCR